MSDFDDNPQPGAAAGPAGHEIEIPAAPGRRRRPGLLINTPGAFTTDALLPERPVAPGGRLAPPFPPHGKRETAPLLLLPLRLEYRVVERQLPPPVTDTLAELRALLAAAPARRPARRLPGLPPLDPARQAAFTLHRRPALPAPATLTSDIEIWFRWYPDDGFVEKGILPADDFENAALTAFDTAVAGRSWLDVGNAAVAAAWQTLASRLGPARAIHLLRSRSAVAGPAAVADHVGRIAALPRRVVLFALTDAGQVELLVKGADLPGEIQAERIAYTPAAIEPGSWLNSFSAAVSAGMGVKISDPDRVKAALAADWIVAVGLYSGDATGEIEALLRDAVANGNFAVIPQDTPTNRSEAARSPVTDPQTDLLGFLELATQEERGQAADDQSAASLLSAALGVDSTLMRRAVNAADLAAADARAILRVVGPALLDSALQAAPGLVNVDENEFINTIAGSISARGVLPALRFGRNPYGLLPITHLDDFQVDGKVGVRPGVERFLLRYSLLLRAGLAPRTARLAQVIAPGDPQSAQKLDRMLKTYPVSRRVDVTNTGSSQSEALGCEYVRGRGVAPAVYLADLRTKSLNELPDPDETDRAWPLLYRLARLSLVSNTLLGIFNADNQGTKLKLHDLAGLDPAKRADLFGHPVLAIPVNELHRPGRIPGFANPAIVERLRTVAADFSAALARLEAIARQPDGIPRLETLLLETIDLFQHRVDAWATGLAHARLTTRRTAGQAGLHAGYYGFLGRLRPSSVSGSSDGYLQAPSQAQAVSAALLRSAYLRHSGGGAFNISLPSQRVQRALALLEMLQRGLSLPEILGYRGERWLHDRRADALITRLRIMFPPTNPTPPESTGAAAQPTPVVLRLFDGLAFVNSRLNRFTAQERPTAQALQQALADDLDALSDLVMCEAVHQRALGQSEVANAWLQVLSGSPVPGDPEFIRTQRHGQGASHRLIVTLPPTPAPANPTPREIAEPALAALATRLLPRFAQAAAAVTVERLPPGRRITLNVSLRVDLGMHPIDLLIGGESELLLRLRRFAAARWQIDAGMITALGPLPDAGVEAFINREAAFHIDLDLGPVDMPDLLRRAALAHAVFQSGRPLEAGDLNAAADPNEALTEAAEVALLFTAASTLRGRIQTLHNRLEQDRAAYDNARSAFVTAASEARRRSDAGAPEAGRLQALSAVENTRRNLVTALLAVSRYSEPDALRVISTGESAANPAGVTEFLDAIAGRLVARRDRLNAALSGTGGAPPTVLSEARRQVRELRQALQGALDGEALPVLPPVARTRVTTPLLDSPVSPSQALKEWAPVRSTVGHTLSLASLFSNLAAFPVAAAATDDEDPNSPDPRPPEEAPRSRHFGVLIGDRNGLPTVAEWVGVVTDEWVEQRPSRTQMAALALNYDSPQSEPPHCLLLCVAPNPSYVNWTERRAVDMVLETIGWMKIRALSSEHKPTPGALLPNANQVPEIVDGNRRRNRLPNGRYKQHPLLGVLGEGVFTLAADPASEAIGVHGMGFNEIDGFFEIQE